MDENAWAKSDPKEDIQTHTDNLLKNLSLLKELYPNLLVDWGLLHWACVYHDLGKLHYKFQDRIKTGKVYSSEIPHGLLSLAFIDYKALKRRNYNRDDIKLLFQAVAYHHDRPMPYTTQEIEEEFAGLFHHFEGFKYDKLPQINIANEIDRRYFNVNQRFYEGDGDLFFRFIMLEGLLNRLDYAASAHIPVENTNDFLETAMNNMMHRWKEQNQETQWNDMQVYMRSSAGKNIIVIAQTGMGKTEGGLLWLGDAKGFFTLPLKSAINAIYKRITNDIVLERVDERVGLLHSDTYLKYLEQGEKDESLSPDIYYTKTRQLSLPLTICTLDQIFDFVFRYRGFEQKLATLSYSRVIIDEVQMYSSELMAYLVLGLHYITRMGGKFAIMTATLPAFFLDLLREQGIQFESQRVFTNNIIRHSLKVLDKEINVEDIADFSCLYGGKKILVICNTIKKAVSMYHQLRKRLDDQNVRLLHGCFTKADRATKEAQISKMGKKDNAECGIWVATQIVEASLDLDFDMLFTELSDLNGLFQRMGRCYRNRALDIAYNCFVFTGGEKRCSGVGAFIDTEIHLLSKKSLSDVDGVIEEAQKIAMVKFLYTKEKLPAYYAAIVEDIRYVQSITDYELNRQEVRKRFRNINTISVIPCSVYDEHEVEIQKAVKMLQVDYHDMDKTAAKARRARARSTIANQTVDISAYLARNFKTNLIKINDYERLIIIECGYNSDEGIIGPASRSTDVDFLSHSF